MLHAMRFSKDLYIDRAMVIYAHPDDAEFSVAGTVAKWTKAGVEVTYCMVTNGASGSQDPKMTRAKLRDTRYAEQRKAAKVLGVKHVVFLGYEDGYLYPTLEVRRDVARQVRIHKPDVILAMDPQFRVSDGYINHPDHIAAGEVALRTINPDASTLQMFPELWRDEKLEPTSRRRSSSKRSARAAPSSTSPTRWRPRSRRCCCIAHSSVRRRKGSCATGPDRRTTFM